MTMKFDYKGMQALCSIIEEQSFEAAALKLCITQSAVSQRLKALQQYYGDPLLVRGDEYIPTNLGAELLAHYKKIKYIEEDTQQKIQGTSRPIELIVAVSRDMLDTWFLPIIIKKHFLSSVRISVIADDQDVTHRYLQMGKVSCCFSTVPRAVVGCDVSFIGNMRYVLVATPQIKKKYFKGSDQHHNLLNAPIVKFDEQDQLNNKYLAKHFDIMNVSPPCFMVPSVRGFRELVLSGSAYALIPERDIQKELASGRLITLFPKKYWDMPIFFHYWMLGDAGYSDAIARLKKYAAICF